MRSRLLAGVLLFMGGLAVAPASAQKVAASHMIVAANPYAAKAGLAVLQDGGTAVDAAIATQMVLTLVEPESSGIGGGAFMLLWDEHRKHLTSFDGRETAPASAKPTMFLDAAGKPRAHIDAIPGGLSVGVPGVLAMLDLAHRKYGKLSWARLLQPAIDLADKGFAVPKKLAFWLTAYPGLADMPDIKRHFFHPDGSPFKEGETIKNPELAATLRLIAKDGPKAFYDGPIAGQIVEAVQHAPVNPGGMMKADLAKFKAQERVPVCGPYRRMKVCSMGPPSSGGIAVLQILEMLSRFPREDLRAETLSGVHLFTQASRLAFADRAAYLGDPAFVTVPVKGLLDPRYLAKRSLLIDPAKDMGTASAGLPEGAPKPSAKQRTPEHAGTSQISIVDDKGQVVSMTTTVESPLGSKLMVGGFILNNELTDFSFDPVVDGRTVANAPAPGKRPLSAMSPSIVFSPDGTFRAAVGSPGGPMIIDYVAGALLALIDENKPPFIVVGLPHVGNLNSPTILEKGTSLEALGPKLTAMGHALASPSVEKSGLNIIVATPRGYVGGSDPRRDGVALGD